MSDAPQVENADAAPGDERPDDHDVAQGMSSYVIGLGLATIITVVAFFIAQTDLVWPPSIPIALFVLAVGQMGVHLVFFLHITAGPDSTNNVPGARLRSVDRAPLRGRVALHHDQPQPQHDPDGSDDADATVSVITPGVVTGAAVV